MSAEYFLLMLLRNNLGTVDSAHFNWIYCSIQYALKVVYTCETTTIVKIQISTTPKKMIPDPLKSIPFSIHDSRQPLICFSISLKFNRMIYILGLASFTQHNVFKAHLCCCTYQKIYALLLLSSIPLCGYNTFCLSIHLLMDIWSISSC